MVDVKTLVVAVLEQTALCCASGAERRAAQNGTGGLCGGEAEKGQQYCRETHAEEL